MNLKLYAWYFLHDKPKFWSDVRRKLHVLTLEKSQYYKDCVRFYDSLDVKDKVVIDVGCDFGTTPMYFLRKGATTIFGFSKDKQYFHDERYKHYNVDEDPSALPSTILNIKRIKNEMVPPCLVLKSDCEGCEWNFTKEFIDSFEDWIIAVHIPIGNNELYDYIKDKGELIGKEEGSEIGIYHKNGDVEHTKFMSMPLGTYKLFVDFVKEMNHINLQITKKIELVNNALKAIHLNSVDNIEAMNKDLNGKNR